MSLHRRAAKRDGNEACIVARLEEYGFFVGRVSMAGWPDLVALRYESSAWCEVKQPGESFTPEQAETFAAMRAKGVDVYVLETEGDADALAEGSLAPWTGEGITIRDSKRVHRGKRKHRPGYSRARTVGEQCGVHHCCTSQLSGARWCATHVETA